MNVKTETRFEAPAWEKIGVFGILVYFVGRMVFFALNVPPNIPPDEIAHVGIIRLYAGTVLGITNTAESVQLGLAGLVTNVPFLYHALLGKLLMAGRLFGIDDYVFLRTINVAFAALTAVIGYRLSRMLVRDAWARILILVMATNTLMETFLGASVSYDNLINLLAVASLAALVDFFQSSRGVFLLVLLAEVCAGCLTKLSFLPLAGLLFLVYLFERRSTLLADAKLLLQTGFTGTTGERLILGLCVVLFAGTAWLYGVNMIRFHSLNPPCNRVLSADSCMQNRTFARDWILKLYRQGEMSYGDAVSAAQKIPMESDRLHALRLLDSERMFKARTPPLLDPFNYIKSVWANAMKPSIFGIIAHRSVLKKPDSLVLYDIVFLAAFIAWIRRIRFDRDTRILNYLAFVCWGYFLFLVGYVNYTSYLATHQIYLGVQGRYIFPVIFPAYLLAAEALSHSLPGKIRVPLFILIAMLFLWGDLPSLLADPDYRWLMSA